MDLLDFPERCVNVVVFCGLAEVNSHWELSGGNVDNVRAHLWEQSGIVLEVLNSQSSTHNDDAKWEVPVRPGFALFPLLESQFASGVGNSSQQTHDDVTIETPLVGLVYHYNCVLGQHEVVFHFLQKDAISHELDSCLCLRVVLRIESDLVADQVAYLRASLISDPLCQRDCSDSTRLSNANQSRRFWCFNISLELPRTAES